MLAHREKMKTVRISPLSSIFLVLSRSTALLSITYKEGAEKKRRGNVTNKDNQLLIGHASKAHAQ